MFYCWGDVFFFSNFLPALLSAVATARQFLRQDEWVMCHPHTYDVQRKYFLCGIRGAVMQEVRSASGSWLSIQVCANVPINTAPRRCWFEPACLHYSMPHTLFSDPANFALVLEHGENQRVKTARSFFKLITEINKTTWKSLTDQVWIISRNKLSVVQRRILDKEYELSYMCRNILL